MDESASTALLEGLLRRYSPTGQEGQAVEFLTAWMRAQGFDAGPDALGNAVGSKGGGPNEIVLLGHIDTVRGEIPVRREGDLLWGRGAVDAKGPLACFAAAAAAVTPLPGWKITVAGALAEEGDSKGAKHIKDQHRPAFCVIGEPSGWEKVTLGYKGSAWVEYTLARSIEHTASGSESAAEGAVRFWNAFTARRDAFNQGREKQFDLLSSSLRSIHSEEDGFTETARLRFNLRLPPDLTPAQAVSLLEPLAGEGALCLLDGVETYRAEKNTPLVRAFLAAIRAVGGKPGFVLKTGTSDMNIAGPAWGCPILAYGPGDSRLDHTPDEHISISEYLEAIAVLTAVLYSLMQE